MQNTKILKAKLVDILYRNRAKHVKLVKEAKDGHRKKSIKFFALNLALAKAGKKFSVNSNLIHPVEFTDRYDNLISQLEMSLEDSIELDADDFARFVLDKWEWRSQFDMSNAAYYSKKHK